MKNSPVTESLSVGFLFDDTLDSSDGVAQYVKQVGAWLSGHGHKVSYLVGQTQLDSWHGGQVYSLSQNIKANFNGNRMSTPWPASRQLIRDTLDKTNPDILHVQVPYSPLMAGRVINAADKRIAVIGTFHILPSGPLADWGSRLLRLQCWRTIKKFDEMVSVSPAAANFAKKAYKIDSQVLPNVVNLSQFAAGKRTKTNRPKIVFLGRLVKRKGCQELIKAVGHLQNTRGFHNFDLIIAGDGPERSSLEKLVSKLGLSGHVMFLGYIKESQKPDLLASADIACFPSLYGESFGIVLLEAMAAGASIVLAGDNPGYRSVLGQQPKLLINPRQTEQFSGRLEYFLKSGNQSAGIGRWLALEVSRYDIELIGPELVRLYRQAIAKRRSKQ